MRLCGQVTINGQPITGTEAFNWGELTDGYYEIRIPPVWRDAFIHASSDAASVITVRVTIDGLPTVAQLDSRVRGLERAIYRDWEDGYARVVGLWTPKRQ